MHGTMNVKKKTSDSTKLKEVVFCNFELVYFRRRLHPAPALSRPPPAPPAPNIPCDKEDH